VVSKKYRIEVGTDPQQIIQLLEDKIYEYNSAKTHIADGNLFSRVVRGENDEIIAGIAGWTWAGICEITQLWVDEKVRKDGLGKMLLEAAEVETKSKGCHTIMVRSFSFQAPHFYERYGFKTEHIITDFPKAYDYYILSKRIG
jgi:ribosomal protein S18 acetylase RimI-like enzyme